jgi:hypothetical protein
MDKETLSNYGWIVICTLVLAVMLALATPFGEFIRDGVWSTTNGLNDTLNKNMEIVGLNGGSGDNSGGDNNVSLKYNIPAPTKELDTCVVRYDGPYLLVTQKTEWAKPIDDRDNLPVTLTFYDGSTQDITLYREDSEYHKTFRWYTDTNNSDEDRIIIFRDQIYGGEMIDDTTVNSILVQGNHEFRNAKSIIIDGKEFILPHKHMAIFYDAQRYIASPDAVTQIIFTFESGEQKLYQFEDGYFIDFDTFECIGFNKNKDNSKIFDFSIMLNGFFEEFKYITVTEIINGSEVTTTYTIKGFDYDLSFEYD